MSLSLVLNSSVDFRKVFFESDQLNLRSLLFIPETVTDRLLQAYVEMVSF
jgi:hypothetical protein